MYCSTIHMIIEMGLNIEIEYDWMMYVLRW